MATLPIFIVTNDKEANFLNIESTSNKKLTHYTKNFTRAYFCKDKELLVDE